jgi:16S rRNA processing protein RimM
VAADDEELIVVGRIGAAHGVRGEVFVVPWTDDPHQRFAPGAALRTDPVGSGPLTVEHMRLHSGKLVVQFAGVTDRDAAKGLTGTQLLIRAADRQPLADPDDFYDSDLIGLRADSIDGRPLGPVCDVVHAAAIDYLVLDVAGRERLVPFVAAIVPRVDVAAGVLVIDPPEGLFDL